MAEQFTHIFKFEVGEPLNFIRGDVEFNEDGKVSMGNVTQSDPLSKEALVAFNRFLTVMKEIFDEFGTFKVAGFLEKK